MNVTYRLHIFRPLTECSVVQTHKRTFFLIKGQSVGIYILFRTKKLKVKINLLDFPNLKLVYDQMSNREFGDLFIMNHKLINKFESNYVDQ